MNNNYNWVVPILSIIFFILLFSAISYNIYDNATTIDTRVETIDGEIYDCAEATSYENGLTYIRKPYNIQIPTRTIKIIKKLK